MVTLYWEGCNLQLSESCQLWNMAKSNHTYQFCLDTSSSFLEDTQEKLILCCITCQVENLTGLGTTRRKIRIFFQHSHCPTSSQAQRQKEKQGGFKVNAQVGGACRSPYHLPFAWALLKPEVIMGSLAEELKNDFLGLGRERLAKGKEIYYFWRTKRQLSGGRGLDDRSCTTVCAQPPRTQAFKS